MFVRNNKIAFLLMALVVCISITFTSCVNTPVNVGPNNTGSSNSNGNSNNNGKTGSAIYDGILKTMNFNEQYTEKVNKSTNDDDDDMGKLGAELSVVSAVGYHDIKVGFAGLIFLTGELGKIGIIDINDGKIEHKQGEYIVTYDLRDDLETQGKAESKWYFSEDGLSGKNEEIVKNENGTIIKQSIYEYSFKDDVLYTQSYIVKEDRLNEGTFKKNILIGTFTKNSMKYLSGDVELDTCELTKTSSVYKNHPASFDAIADTEADDGIIEADNSKLTVKEGDKEYSWNL